MKFNRLAAKILGIGLFFAILTPSALAKSPDQKKLQVVILAISHFNDESWSNAQLQVSIEKSAKDLKDFFSQRFPNAQIHLLDEAQTDSQGIRDFLRGDFPKFADGTVTLFFVLSHGIPTTSPNPNFNQDLLVVTRDTDHTSPEKRAISVAQDLIPQFVKLKSPGSIVLTFLDTCYSGQAKNLTMRISTALSEEYGLRLLVMASSLSEAQSYKATFSEALIDLWNRNTQGSCTTPELAPDELRKSIAKQLSPQQLGVIEGLPKIVIPYYGKLCMESFSADNGLIVFYNALPSTVAAVVKHGGTQVDPSIPLDFNDVVPYALSRESYELDIVRADETPLSVVTVDLNADPISFQTIGVPTVAQLGTAYARTATYAKTVALLDEQTAFQQRAFASFTAANDKKAASEVASKIAQKGPAERHWELAYLLSNEHVLSLGPGDSPAESQVRGEVGLDGLARVEKLSGRFSKAAVLYLEIAKQKPADVAPKYAEQAYFAAGAAGEVTVARNTREEFGLHLSDCSYCLEREKAALAEREGKTLIDQFRAICTLHLLRHLDF